MLRVTEIFRSIQGESTHAGRPCTFVRLTGCPMRCVWCDSEYTFTGGEHFHGVESDPDSAAFIEMFEPPGSESQQDRRREDEMVVVAQISRRALRFLREPRTVARVGGEPSQLPQQLGGVTPMGAVS